MDYNEFKSWCSSKERDLGKYNIYYTLRDNAPFWWIASFFLVVQFFNYIDRVETFYVVIAFVLSAIFMVTIENLIKLPMSQIEFLACLLNKMSARIGVVREGRGREREELIQDLKMFEKHSKFKYKFSHEELFKESNKRQEVFFDSLNNFPNRIYFAILENKLDFINSEDLGILAFYLYTDDKRKIEILEKISKTNPDSKEIETRTDLFFKKLFRERYFKFTILLLVISSLFYFWVYKILGIDKNTTFTSFMLVLVTVYTIMFRKEKNKNGEP